MAHEGSQWERHRETPAAVLPLTVVCAVDVVREEELVEQALMADKAAQQAHELMLRAESQSAAAEAAKIELSLRLAAALSEQEAAEDISAVPSAPSKYVSHSHFHLPPEALRISNLPAELISDVLHLWLLSCT